MLRAGPLTRGIEPVMLHRDVERDGERLGIGLHYREHVGQIIMIAVEPADHEVRIHVEHVARRARLEPGQYRGDVRAGRAVRARAGDGEPPPVQRGGGAAVAGRFDDPVEPPGFHQTVRHIPQIAQASARVLPEKSVFPGIDDQEPFGECPRPFQLRHQVGNLHVEGGRFHGR